MRSYEKLSGEKFAISSLKAAGPLFLSSGISSTEILISEHEDKCIRIAYNSKKEKGENTNVSQQESKYIKVIYSLNKIR